jgi:hypothetical protein
MISDIKSDNILTGTISEPTALPLAIQSFLDKKSWTISSGITAQGTSFSTSLANVIPEWGVSYGTNKLFSLTRTTGVLKFDPTITLVPDVRI